MSLRYNTQSDLRINQYAVGAGQWRRSGSTGFFLLHFFRSRGQNINFLSVSYVYWTVHHLDSWIKGDQLVVTCFIISLFNAQHVSGVDTSVLRSLRLICWIISWAVLLWFDECLCDVVVWLWWCGIRMQASVYIRIPHHHSQTTT